MVRTSRHSLVMDNGSCAEASTTSRSEAGRWIPAPPGCRAALARQRSKSGSKISIANVADPTKPEGLADQCEVKSGSDSSADDPADPTTVEGMAKQMHEAGEVDAARRLKEAAQSLHGEKPAQKPVRGQIYRAQWCLMRRSSATSTIKERRAEVQKELERIDVDVDVPEQESAQIQDAIKDLYKRAETSSSEDALSSPAPAAASVDSSSGDLTNSPYHGLARRQSGTAVVRGRPQTIAGFGSDEQGSVLCSPC